MTFDIDVKARNLKVDDRLNDYVIKKVKKLDRFIKEIQDTLKSICRAGYDCKVTHKDVQISIPVVFVYNMAFAYLW